MSDATALEWLLAHRDVDGQWAGGALLPAGFDWSAWERAGQPWAATTPALSQLREFGLDPTCSGPSTTSAPRSRRLDDGTRPLDRRLAGGTWFPLDEGEGRPSRWVTLRAMRVLRWYD